MRTMAEQLVMWFDSTDRQYYFVEALTPMLTMLWQNFMSMCREPCVTYRTFRLALDAKLKRETRILEAKCREAETARRCAKLEGQRFDATLRRLNAIHVRTDYDTLDECRITVSLSSSITRSLSFMGRWDHIGPIADYVGRYVASELSRTQFVPTRDNVRYPTLVWKDGKLWWGPESHA